MGVLLSMVTDTGEEPPFDYSSCDDPKVFCRVISDCYFPGSPITQLLAHLGLEFEPFAEFSGEEYSLESFLSPSIGMSGDWHELTNEQKQQVWVEHKHEIEAAYRAPAVFLAALNPLIDSLAARPAVYQAVGITDSYFTTGCFLQHLQDLKHQFDWAQQRGITRVRLMIA